MSFALQVKEEIIGHTFTKEQRIVLLAGFIKSNGEMVYGQGSGALRLTTISNRIARTFIVFLKEFFQGQIEIAIIQSKSLKRYKTFQLTLRGDLEKFLNSLALKPMSQTGFHLLESWKSNLDLLRAYVAGLFIGSGSVNSPKTSNYHLEIQFKTLEEAKEFNQIMNKYHFEFKLLPRKNERYLSYLKKSTMVSDFIKFLDAPQCVLSFENERISRDVVNNINRMQNIDISNQTRTIVASEKQIKAIQQLRTKNSFDELSTKAQALAQLRLRYPDASYQELTQKMQKNGYNNITKSGISNLFRQILKSANYH